MRRILRQRRGIALFMVMAVIAGASVMGWAMLSSTSMQAQLARNTTSAASALTLAESGVNLAAYKLSEGLAAGAWSETINLRPDLPGDVQISVTPDAIDVNVYNVVAIGRVDGGPQSRIQARYRKLRLRCAANFLSGATLNSNGAVTLGSAAAAGTIRLENNSRVVYEACAANLSAEFPTLLPPADAQHPINLRKTWIPDPSAAAGFASYVWQNGATYTAGVVPHTNGVVTTMLPLGPTSDNPAGIRRHVGNLTFRSDLTITGTLVVEGDLILDGCNLVVDATESTSKGMPALIIKGNLVLRNTTQSLVVNGVACISGDVGSRNLGRRTTMTINGALVIGGEMIGTGNGGEIQINYVPANNLDVRGLRRGSNLQLLSWIQGETNAGT